MKEIRELFLNQYDKNVKPFQSYIIKGTLGRADFIPINLTFIYTFAYSCLLDSRANYVLFALIIFRFFSYQMGLKYFIIILLSIFIPLKIVYVIPILVYAHNNYKLAIKELVIDLFLLSVIPYIL